MNFDYNLAIFVICVTFLLIARANAVADRILYIARICKAHVLFALNATEDLRNNKKDATYNLAAIGSFYGMQNAVLYFIARELKFSKLFFVGTKKTFENILNRFILLSSEHYKVLLEATDDEDLKESIKKSYNNVMNGSLSKSNSHPKI
jgi:hypothetical protein